MVHWTEALAGSSLLASYEYSASERAKLESIRSREIVGTPDQVGAGLEALAARLGLDELVIVTWTYDPAPRHRSYELLARRFGLETGTTSASGAELASH